MKTNFLKTMLIVVILASTTLAACNNTSKQSESEEQTAKTEYTCPMHPEVVQDEPGKCPKCKMDLVEKE